MTDKSLSLTSVCGLPFNVVKIIMRYMPRIKKDKQEMSPSLQKQLTKIQHMKLKGKSAMYMRDLEDFCLD